MYCIYIFIGVHGLVQSMASKMYNQAIKISISIDPGKDPLKNGYLMDSAWIHSTVALLNSTSGERPPLRSGRAV